MIELAEVVNISDNVVTSFPPLDILINTTILFSTIALAIIIKYTKFVDKYYFKRKVGKTVPSTPYEVFDLVSLQKIVDKLSRNFTILITIYGFLFAFIISQNFQHVTYSWPVIIWSGWVLAIIVRTANIALILTDIIETAQVNNTIKTAGNMIYAYNRYYKHTTYLLIFAVAFSPAVFLPLNENHHNDYELWTSQISIPTIALGIIGVSFAAYYFAEATDLIKPTGIPNIYFMSIFILAIEPISYISATPLFPLHVVLLGYHFTMPQLFQVILSISAYALTMLSAIMVRTINNYRVTKRQNKKL